MRQITRFARSSNRLPMDTAPLRLTPLAWVVAGLFASLPVAAQTPSATDAAQNLETPADPGSAAAGDANSSVKVTARRREETLKDVPVAVTALGGAQLERLGVRIHLGTFADPDTIAAEKPDEVIVATGSTPRRSCDSSSVCGIPATFASSPFGSMKPMRSAQRSRYLPPTLPKPDTTSARGSAQTPN